MRTLAVILIAFAFQATHCHLNGEPVVTHSTQSVSKEFMDGAKNDERVRVVGNCVYDARLASAWKVDLIRQEGELHGLPVYLIHESVLRFPRYEYVPTRPASIKPGDNSVAWQLRLTSPETRVIREYGVVRNLKKVKTPTVVDAMKVSEVKADSRSYDIYDYGIPYTGQTGLTHWVQCQKLPNGKTAAVYLKIPSKDSR